MLAFMAGQFDMTFPYEVTIPMLKDVHSQMPQAICEMTPENVAPNLLITRKPPFDNLDLRRAIAMTIDHKAFIDILGEGQGDIGTAMLPAPEGLWAMPKEMMEKLPGYDPDVQKRREEARKIMQSLGYGPGQAARGQDLGAQPADLPRPGGDPERPAEADLDRYRDRAGRDRELAAEADPRGLHFGAEPRRQRARRSRPELLRELHLRLRTATTPSTATASSTS